MASDELAERYGHAMSRGRRRALIATGAVVLVLVVAYAAWYALTTGNPKVTWQDIGYQNTSTGVDVTFEVSFSKHADASTAATCTVEALNQVRTIVGQRDVRVGPLGSSSLHTIRMTASVKTSETANTGLVDTCVLDPSGD